MLLSSVHTSYIHGLQPIHSIKCEKGYLVARGRDSRRFFRIR